MSQQISFFDIERETLIQKATPRFEKGQSIYILSLDVVLSGTVGHSWLCDLKEKEPFFGYSIDFPTGRHDTVWDYLIEKTVFFSKEDADRAAAKIIPKIVKIKPSDIKHTDKRCFEYIRGCDNYRLEAILAKVGDTQLYEAEFMCYDFLRTYPNKSERDKEYKAILNKTLAETERTNGKEIDDAPFVELYRVTDELYASREYALSNGKEYITTMAALNRMVAV